MDIIIMVIVLCHIYVRAVEYILDDQTINSEQISLIFTNYCSFKEAVVSG